MMKKWFSLLIISLLLPLNVWAEPEVEPEEPLHVDEFIINCDSINMNINDQMICRIGVANYGFNFDKISYDLEISEGLNIVDVRSNYDKLWKVEKNGATSNEENIGLQEFGIILIKSVSSGEKEVKLKNIIVENSHNDNKKSYKDVTYKVKVISDNNDLEDIIVDDKSLEDFNKNKMSYNYYIDDNITKLKIDTVNSNEFSKVVGSGEYDIPLTVEKTIIPIEVISENGNKKVYKINIIREDFKKNNIDKEIKSIKITNNKGNIILLNFKSNIYSYSIEVNSDITNLNIEAEINEDVKFVSGYGARKVSISSGNNIILMKIIDEDGEILNYEISVTKPLLNKSSNNYIKSLVITGYDLNFSKRVRNYNLKVKKGTKSLDIKPILEDEKASYEIVGNNNIEDGKVIKIIVTAENQVKNVYQINISYKSSNLLVIIAIGVGMLSLLYFGIKKKNRNSKKSNNKNNSKKSPKVNQKSNVSKTSNKTKVKGKNSVKNNKTKTSTKPSSNKKSSRKSKSTKKAKTNGKNKKKKKKKK